MQQLTSIVCGLFLAKLLPSCICVGEHDIKHHAVTESKTTNVEHFPNPLKKCQWKNNSTHSSTMLSITGMVPNCGGSLSYYHIAAPFTNIKLTHTPLAQS
jgi:hypothetical protein